MAVRLGARKSAARDIDDGTRSGWRVRMAQGGGRGWFRRRAKVEPDTSQGPSDAARQPLPQSAPYSSPGTPEPDALGELFGQEQWSPEARQAPPPIDLEPRSQDAAPGQPVATATTVPSGPDPADADRGTAPGSPENSAFVAPTSPPSEVAPPPADADSPSESTDSVAPAGAASTSAGAESPFAGGVSTPLDDSTGSTDGPALPSPSPSLAPQASPVAPQATEASAAHGTPSIALHDGPVRLDDAPTASESPAPTNELQSPPSHDATPTPHSAPAQESRIDWDAATAAALSGEGIETHHAAAPNLSRGDPDKLLEDIIREIVGDAAVETLSSLQESKPSQSIAQAERGAADSGRAASSGSETAPFAPVVENDVSTVDEGARIPETHEATSPQPPSTASSIEVEQFQELPVTPAHSPASALGAFCRGPFCGPVPHSLWSWRPGQRAPRSSSRGTACRRRQ